jgi:poly-gamma-glutamate synthesis protein (capsule biosynthesis protein)
MDFLKNSEFKYILLIVILLIAIFGISALRESGPQIVEIRNSAKNGQLNTETITPLSVLFVGDVMLDRKVEAQMEKNGYGYPFEKIKDFLGKNDFVFANLEGPISKNPAKFSLSAMTFAFSDKVIQPLLDSNFRIFSLANNHTLNMYGDGLEETKTILKQAGIDWVGDPLACSNDYIEKENLIFMAFNTTFSECGEDTIVGIIERTKKENSDKFMIISMHWGEEYKTESSRTQKQLAHEIIDAGADLIIGHHPHVAQEYEKYKDKMIFYSLGNFIFDQYFSEETQQGLAVRLEVYPASGGVHGPKILYRIIPIESIISQPQLMEKEEAEKFMKERGFESIIGIRNVEIGKVCLGIDCFHVETVSKSEDLALGLMFRKNLDQDRGMLFVFSEVRNHSFWMKNTLIPLDIIWLNENMEVVYIGENIQPCAEIVCKGINPVEKSKYVLELNAGAAQKINLKIGDKLEIRD